MKKILLITALLGAFGYTPLISYGQAEVTISGNEKDGKFLSDIMGMNMYELALLKMTSEKAQAAELREMANSIVGDHQRMDAQLTGLANRMNFAVNPEQKDKYTSKIRKWDSDPVGAGWDRDMVEELVDLHKDGIDMFKDAMNSVQDGELKELASIYLPKLQGHLDMLLPLKGRVKDGDVITASTPPVAVTGVGADIPTGNEKDAKFISDLRIANLYELRLMELVFKKGNHRELKNAAQHMIEDHQKLDVRVREYSRRHGYGIDPDEGSKVNEKLAKWNQKRGGMEWDADVIEELKDVHKDGIDMLEDATNGAKDDELRSLIKDALPKMRMHLEMLEPLKEKVKKPWNDKK
jgi:putative membrane protein